jgi:hypothetical protein
LFRGGSQPKVPTVSAAIDSIRQAVIDRKELLVLYFNFDRYTKIEEIYGWEKLDQVLETTVHAIRDFLAETQLATAEVVVNFVNDDDFVVLYVPLTEAFVPTPEEITEMTANLHQYIASRVEEEHGDDISSLFDTFVGSAHVHYDPKIRLERQIYRAIRDAASSSNSVSRESLLSRQPIFARHCELAVSISTTTR